MGTTNKSSINLEALEVSIKKAQQLLLNRQREDGRWEASLYYNAWTSATFIITLYAIGAEKDTTSMNNIKRAAIWILENQNEDGSWGFIDLRNTNSNLEITCQCNVALEIAGYSDTDQFKKGTAFANNLGGVINVPFLTQMYHCTVDKFFWNYLFPIPAELFLIPDVQGVSPLLSLSVWGQIALFPAIALMALNNTDTSRITARISLEKVKNWIFDHQNSDGSWYCTIFPTSISLIALKQMGIPLSDSRMQAGIAFMNTLQDKNGLVHRYTYPVWNTVLACSALIESGIPGNNEQLLKAGKWLLDAQNCSGNRAWAFHPKNILYPDVDDTSFAACIINQLDIDPQVKQQSVDKAIDWIFEMQGKDGGWAAFSKNTAVKKSGIPPMFLVDPATADVTGHVLFALGKIGLNKNDPRINRAIEWLKNDQNDRAWYGRWGICYTYGSGSVLSGLEGVGEKMDADYIQNNLKWFIEHQNSDGGWGETTLSYYYPWYGGIGESTVEQTAWSLIGLLSTSQYVDPKVIERGIKFILDNQTPDGAWASSYVDAALWVYKDDLYSTVFPLTALGLYYSNYLKNSI